MVKHHKEEISSIVIPSVSHGHVWAYLIDWADRYVFLNYMYFLFQV